MRLLLCLALSLTVGCAGEALETPPESAESAHDHAHGDHQAHAGSAKSHSEATGDEPVDDAGTEHDCDHHEGADKDAEHDCDHHEDAEEDGGSDAKDKADCDCDHAAEVDCPHAR